MSKKIYVIAYCNNVGDGLYIDENYYTTMQDVWTELKRSYNSVKSLYDKRLIEESEIGDWSYFVMTTDGDIFRASVQEFQI